ncbi:MAG: hypothetical protein K1X57_17915, partial [Gemmataceae bacterium]|nr:hypothetical protein [Gemmataceae bacterium]
MSISRVFRRLPLRLQELESRTVPASVFWTGGGSSGNWHDPLNWSSNPSLPANGDDVTIATATTVTFTGSTPAVNLNSLDCNAPFALSGSTLSIGAGGGSFNSGWSQSSGTLSGTGTITLNSAGLWTGGTWSGTGTTVIAAGKSLKIDSSTTAPSINNRVVQNLGSTTWVATGGAPQNINTGDGGWTNFSGSLFDVQANTNWVNVFGSTATPVTTNAGASLTRTVGTGTARFDGPFNNDSTVTVSTGTLQLGGGGTSTGKFSLTGSLLVSANTLTLNAGANVTGSGTMTLGSATLKVNSSVNIDSPFSQTAGQVTGVGPLNLTKTATWTGGSQLGPGVTVIPAGATWTLDTSTNTLQSNSRTVDISGAVTWLATGGSPQSMQTGDGGWNIKTGGQFDIQTNNTWVHGFGSGATPITVDSGGKLLRTAGSATASIQGAVNNYGTVQVTSGTLQINGGGTSTGTYNVATEVKFNGGTSTWAAGANSTGAGKITLGSATLTASGAATIDSGFEQTTGLLTGAGPWNLNGKSLWTGGQQTGPGVTVISASGLWTLDSTVSSLPLNGRTVNLSGAATWIATGVSPQGLLTGDGAWNIKTGGSFDIQANTSWSYGYGSGGTPINVEAGGLLLRTTGSATATLQGPLNNSGTVTISSGTLRAIAGGTSNGQFALAADLLYNGGTHTWTTGANSTGAGRLILGSSTLTTAGSVNVDSKFEQTAGVLTGSGTWNLNGNATWTGGQQLGPGQTAIPLGAKWTIDTTTNSLVSNNRTYTLSGSAVWLASGASPQNILTGDGGFNIKAGGTFDVQVNNSWSYGFGAGGTPINIEIGGKLLRSTGSGTATIGAPVNNAGNISVSSGAMNFSAGGTNSATIDVATTLNLTAGTYTWNTGTTTSGVGKVAVTGGTLSVAGSASVGSQFLQSGGFISGVGTLTLNSATWTGGQLLGPGTTVIAVGGNWVIDSSTNSLIMNDRQVINSGSTTWMATGASPQNLLTADGLWTNKFGSTMTLQANNTWSWWSGMKATPIVNEPGSTLRRNTGTGTVSVNGSVTNNGTIQADT